MKYTIKNLEKILEDGVATKQLLTLEVEHNSGNLTEHGKHISLEANPKEEAVNFAAELELVLTDEPVITTEEVEIASKDKVVKDADVAAKVAELEAEEVIN